MTYDASADIYHTYIRFEYDLGSGTVLTQYTNAANAVTTASFGIFQPEPTFQVTQNKVQGDIQEKTWRFKMESRDPIDSIITGQAFPRVTVTIYDALDSDVDGTIQVIWKGALDKVEVDDRGVSVCEVAGTKANLLDRPLGYSCTTTCPHRFGNTLCGIDIGSITETATVQSISGTTIEVTGLTTTTTNAYFHRGYLKLGGLSLLVREYTTGETFVLAQEAPSFWVGEVVDVVPGCDKLVQTCRTRWNNEERFGGTGIAIPSDTPLASGL